MPINRRHSTRVNIQIGVLARGFGTCTAALRAKRRATIKRHLLAKPWTATSRCTSRCSSSGHVRLKTKLCGEGGLGRPGQRRCCAKYSAAGNTDRANGRRDRTISGTCLLLRLRLHPNVQGRTSRSSSLHTVPGLVSALSLRGCVKTAVWCLSALPYLWKVGALCGTVNLLVHWIAQIKITKMKKGKLIHSHHKREERQGARAGKKRESESDCVYARSAVQRTSTTKFSATEHWAAGMRGLKGDGIKQAVKRLTPSVTGNTSWYCPHSSGYSSVLQRPM